MYCAYLIELNPMVDMFIIFLFIYMFVIDYYMINAMLAFKMHIYAYMHISLFICLFLINSQEVLLFTNEGRDKVD